MIVWPRVLIAVPVFTLAPPGVSVLTMGLVDICSAAGGSSDPA